MKPFDRRRGPGRPRTDAARPGERPPRSMLGATAGPSRESTDDDTPAATWVVGRRAMAEAIADGLPLDRVWVSDEPGVLAWWRAHESAARNLGGVIARSPRSVLDRLSAGRVIVCSTPLTHTPIRSPGAMNLSEMPRCVQRDIEIPVIVLLYFIFTIRPGARDSASPMEFELDTSFPTMKNPRPCARRTISSS